MKNLRVALVEDDARLRAAFAQLIEQAPDLTCVGASGSAEDALAALPTLQPDVVLMDINLPGMNGIECTRRLKAQCPNTQIVMLTTFDANEKVFESLAAGATGYVLKRAHGDEVLDAVRDVFAGGSPMSAAIARKVVQYFSVRRPVPAEAASAQLELLSEREHAVLKALAECQQYKEIADNLGISINTVRTYIKKLYEKLQVITRHEAVRALART